MALEEQVAQNLTVRHLNDPNFDTEDVVVRKSHEIHDIKEHHDKEKESDIEAGSIAAEIEHDLDDDSPYPEVRASVANTDDPTMPTNTFRMWFLGIFATILLSGMNQFFSLRFPSVFISSLVAQLVALPLGKFLERVLPAHEFNTFGYKWSLNPSPFNIKEHVLITVMANVSSGGAYATDILGTQRTFYGQQLSVAYQLLLVISTQLIGFAFAGICRRFLVWPAAMIWPANLVQCALFNTLHATYGQDDEGRISRGRFFVYAFLGSFTWYWFPGYIFQALSVFNWACWIAPNNIVVNNLFGYSHGLGMGFVTFDWAQIAYTGSPLVTPWWAEANVFAALVIVYWIICPILYYHNVFFAKFMPISSSGSFDNTGSTYDPTRIVVNGVFQEDLYRAYSPLFISSTFAISYGMSFGSITATIMHTILWYRHDIVRQFRSALKDETDVHARLMTAYPEVPQWWYISLGVVSWVLGMITIEIYNTQLPVWAFFLALIISLVYMVPIGIIQAITNQQVGLNVITELIIGYALPGRPIAMMIFKTFGYITMAQALSFVGDLKLGHYMKIPPRMMFTCQTVATLLACFVVVGVQDWMFGHIEDICQPTQKDGFICPGIRVFATASLIWGGIGPRRTFSPGAVYYPLTFFFLIGALLPIPFYFAARKYPQSWFRYVNIPVFFTGTGGLPPATGINYSSWAMVGFVFQYWIRRRHFKWWSRYNYILSAAMDSGVAIATIVIFFTLEFPKNGSIVINWWGNNVSFDTADARGDPFYTLQNNATFGPTTWS